MILLRSPEATIALGAQLGAVLRIGDVVALSGPLGSGKTLFTRGVLRGLGYAGDVPSPSFPIVIPYEPPALRLPLTHVDLYRIEDAAAVAELGLDDARQEGALVIEWPTRLGPQAWHDMLLVCLVPTSDTSRTLTVQVPPAWENRWPPK